MKEAFPNDRQLTQLPAMLNSDSMSEILSRHLQIAVVDCRPRYIRYKPETSCIIQYELRFTEDELGTTSVPAFIKVYADGRGQAKAESGGARRLQERLDITIPAIPKVTYLPELEGVFQVYPADVDLRPLARISQRASAEKLLRRMVNDDTLSLTADPEMIRYKPGRKALLKFQTNRGVLYGKAFESIDPTTLAIQTGHLIGEGIRAPAVSGVSTRHRTIIHEEAPGVALNQIRHQPAFVSWMKPLADSLWGLQNVQGLRAKEHRLTDEISALKKVAELLSRVVPELSDRLELLTATTCSRLAEQEDILVPAHGDFYDDQAMISGDGLSLIDFDELRLSHPLIDVGNMLAHLSSTTSRGSDMRTAHHTFRQEALKHLHVRASDLDIFEAACLLKLSPGPFRRLETDWVAGIERILDLVELKLAANKDGSRLEQSSFSTDAKLPQLAQLLNRNIMSAAFREKLGLPSSVADVEIVRHKVGRRAILRFDMEDGSRLFGKTFASGRGARVNKVWNAIVDSDAFGPDVTSPEPAGWIAEHKLFLTREVTGNPVQDQLVAGDTELAAQITFALFHLHSSSIHLDRWHDLDDEYKPLPMRADKVMKHAPELAREAEWLHQAIMEFDTSEICWRYRPVHRDMYHDQLLIKNSQLVVLDLDDAAMSEPLVDVANFVAHLMLLGIQEFNNAGALQSVIDAFVEQYRQLDSDFDGRLHQYLVTMTLLRLAGIHVSRDNGASVASQLLNVATRLLVELEPAYPHR